MQHFLHWLFLTVYRSFGPLMAPANQDESMNIPCCDFNTGNNGQDAVSIKFRSLYDILEKLE
ncbi:hypothetical protein, partial [Streptomyces zhihengii]|uniref:hypothetical protein n=1 Tax=Streptomyces zhihengii TaxID=1818004 RepID=UPI0033B3BD41